MLFPAVSAWMTPQLAGAIAATGTAALFEPLARRHFGPNAWIGAVVFGAGTAIDLYTGRLAFAFGALPALAAIVALDYELSWLAVLLALASALCSPVAALFAGLAASGYALGALVGERRLLAALPGVAVVVAALLPVGLIAIAFPEGGVEPFGVLDEVPVLLLAAVAFATAPRESVRLRAGVAIYGLAVIGSFLVPSPVGSNIARLGAFLAAPSGDAAVVGRPAQDARDSVLPLLYLGWEAPARDLVSSSNDQSASTQYYAPLVQFLRRQHGAPFRIEIPFTAIHWEAYVVATHFPIARGWERQLDVKDNAIFYGGHLTAAGYEGWLHANAVTVLVAAPDADLDYSAQAEIALIDHGLPYLHLVMRSRHWRVYAVAHATPIVAGAATLTALDPPH